MLLLVAPGCSSDSDGVAPGRDAGKADGSAADAGLPDASGSDAAVDAAPIPCGQRNPPGDPPWSGPWRYGGGPGYPDPVRAECADFTVSSAEDLQQALSQAASGDVVYVDDAANIDLTGRKLCIPAGVTLASGRGAAGSSGGRLYVTEIVSTPVLEICGDGVRITGIQLEGAHPDQCPPQHAAGTCTGKDKTGGINCRDCMPFDQGIRADGYDRLEVDNCEISSFGLAGVRVRGSVDNHVHHNFIHHTQREGIGYGVLLSAGKTTVVIEGNRFDYFRHAVASSGDPPHEYEARYNLVLENNIGWVFDVHGYNEQTSDGNPLAGKRFEVHHNTIVAGISRSFVVRGRPEVGAWFYDNCTSHSKSAATKQQYFFGNFFVDESPTGPAPNRYSKSLKECEPDL